MTCSPNDIVTYQHSTPEWLIGVRNTSNRNYSDLLIRGFSDGSTDTIIDVRVTNIETKT